jgi:hypothetical protein
MIGLRHVLLLLMLHPLSACAAPQPDPAPAGGGPRIAVHLVSQDKHSGIAVRRADIPAGLWPETRDFPDADYLEVGWGEREYYYGRDQGFLGTLRAAFAPNNRSVLHVAGVRGPLPASFPASEIVELMLTREGFERLVRYIHDAYDRTGRAGRRAARPGAVRRQPVLSGAGVLQPASNLQRLDGAWAARRRAADR